MSLYGYTFLAEVEDFDIEDYIEYMDWPSAAGRHIRIYIKEGSIFFYLHDELKDRLFQFSALDPSKLKTKEASEDVVKTYLLTKL